MFYSLWEDVLKRNSNNISSFLDEHPFTSTGHLSYGLHQRGQSETSPQTTGWILIQHGPSVGLNLGYTFFSRRQLKLLLRKGKKSSIAIEIVDLPIKNGDFPMKNGDFPMTHSDFPMKHGDFPMKHSDFPFFFGKRLPGRVNRWILITATVDLEQWATGSGIFQKGNPDIWGFSRGFALQKAISGWWLVVRIG